MMDYKNKMNPPMKELNASFHDGWYEQFYLCIGMRGGSCSAFPDLYRADDRGSSSSGEGLGIVHGASDTKRHSKE
jgi:hypothetical protein